MNISEVNHRGDIGKLLAARRLLGAAADVGVATGRTALESLRWGFQKVYLVDLWAKIIDRARDIAEADEAQDVVFRECMEKLKDYRDRLVILRGWSHLMAEFVPDDSLDFCHLDASHDYDAVRRDWTCWYPKLRSGVGAIVAGHDYSNPELGVKQAVDELAAEVGIEVHVIPGAGETDATFWFEK